MKRGVIYLVPHPAGDPKRQRAFVVVSRQVLIDEKFSTVMCAPIYSSHDGLATQVPVNTAQGLKHPSSIHCDALVSLQKAQLTNYIGSLPADRLALLNDALRVALDVEE